MSRGTWYFALILGFSLQLGAQSRDYYGAELRTRESFLHGRFETRLQAGQGDGFLSSFFLYNDSFPATDWAEIDFEVLGRWPDNVDLNIIDENGSHLRQNPTWFTLLGEFHDYAFEWTPDDVAWFVDGTEVYRQSGDHISDLLEPCKLMMNIWNPVQSDWVGSWDDRILPRQAVYDWVSYADYTPGTGDAGTGLNFTLAWRDEFDHLDTTRWEASENHTWNGNQALFVSDNANIVDGRLVLSLTSTAVPGVADPIRPYALWGRIRSTDTIYVRFSEELDSLTASSAASYSVSAAVVESASLLADRRSVVLGVSGLVPGIPHTLAILGVSDDALPPNTQLGQVITLAGVEHLSLPIHINTGGGSAQGYLPDLVWSADVEYGREGGNLEMVEPVPDIPGTPLDSVLASSLNRFSRYHVRLQPGIFDVKLSFVESGYSQPGERSFQVFVEDSMVAADLDVVAEVGPGQVYELFLPGLAISDGSLDILCAANVYGRGYVYAGPFLSALDVDGEFFADVDNHPNISPRSFGLLEPYPNPSNGGFALPLRLPPGQGGEIRIYDLNGGLRLSRAIPDSHEELLIYHLDPVNLSSGIYLAVLEAGDEIQARKLTLIQ